jgi:hypothetical protein
MHAYICRYAILLLPEKAGSSPYMIGRVQGQPSAKDLLVTIASHCMEPSTGGAPVRPKQLLLAYRCDWGVLGMWDICCLKHL